MSLPIIWIILIFIIWVTLNWIWTKNFVFNKFIPVIKQWIRDSWKSISFSCAQTSYIINNQIKSSHRIIPSKVFIRNVRLTLSHWFSVIRSRLQWLHKLSFHFRIQNFSLLLIQPPLMRKLLSLLILLNLIISLYFLQSLLLQNLLNLKSNLRNILILIHFQLVNIRVFRQQTQNFQIIKIHRLQAQHRSLFNFKIFNPRLVLLKIYCIINNKCLFFLCWKIRRVLPKLRFIFKHRL